jgi:SAM-dependent methyltransferase
MVSDHVDSMARELADQALFDTIAEHYARKDSIASSSLARRSQLLSAIRPVLDAQPSLGTVVEIGCGVGAPARYLMGRYERYIGIDQSEEMIEAARLFNQGNTKANFLVRNARAPDLEPHVADTILSSGALHHMTELDEVMESLVRIARPGAYLVVIEPQNGNPILQLMRWVRGKMDPSYSCDQIYFSEQDLTDLFRGHGISDLSIDFQGFLSTPFAQVVLFPQVLSTPLSRAASRIDPWLADSLPGPLKRLSFNIVIIGRYTG